MVTNLLGSHFFDLLQFHMSVQDHMQVALSRYDSYGQMNQPLRDNCLFSLRSHYKMLSVFNCLSFLKHLSYVVTNLLGSRFATIKYPHVTY